MEPSQEHDNFGESAIQREVLQEKCQMLTMPGFEMTFDPHEAEQAGAFLDDALTEEDAREAVFDEYPLGKDS